MGLITSIFIAFYSPCHMAVTLCGSYAPLNSPFSTGGQKFCQCIIVLVRELSHVCKPSLSMDGSVNEPAVSLHYRIITSVVHGAEKHLREPGHACCKEGREEDCFKASVPHSIVHDGGRTTTHAGLAFAPPPSSLATHGLCASAGVRPRMPPGSRPVASETLRPGRGTTFPAISE
jgi:hypothetical protein